MVHYKSLDYLQHAVNHKQKFLSRSLLTEPHHLEHVENYLHSGKLSDTCFQTPWKRANVDEDYLQRQRAKTELDLDMHNLTSSMSANTKFIETFDSNDSTVSAIEHGLFNLLEFVPSSNPTSPTICHELQYSDTENKCLDKEDLRKIQSTNEGGTLKMEEMLPTNYLLDMTKSLPSSKVLICRLHPNQVQDPLLSKDEKTILQMKCFQKVEKYDDEQITSTQQLKLPSHWKDECKKYDLNGSQKLLEDCLLPWNEDNDETTNMNWKCIMATEGDTEMSFVSTDISLMECLQNSLQTGYKHTSVEPVEMHFQDVHNKSFLELNELGDDEKTSEFLLDTPISITSSEEDVTVNCLSQKILGDLHACVMPHDDYRLLSKDQREEVNFQVWQYEKFFDDVLSLRFPEPQIRNEYTLDISPADTWKKMNLKPDDDLGKTELLLCWDITTYIRHFPHVPAVEKFGCDINVKLKPVQKSTEVFTKVDSVIMYGCDDKLVIDHEQKIDRDDFNASNDEKVEASIQFSDDFGVDPLSNFMRMRGSDVISKNEKMTSHHTLQATGTDNSLNISDYDLNITNQVPGTSLSKKSARREWHSRTVTVQITGQFEKALNLLEESASFYMAALNYTGDLHPLQKFPSLMPDTTRFLMKQKEKLLEDENNDGSSCDSYKAIVAVHALCGAYELLNNCCLESALGHLDAVQQKYNSVLHDCLNDSQKKLWELQCHFHENCIVHPKLVALYKEIELTLTHKTSNDVDTKVLIIIKRDLQSLSLCLKQFLSDGSAFKSDVLQDASSENIIKSLDDVSCLIVFKGLISDSFPWSQFSSVIEYEREENSQIRDLCQSQKIAHVTLEMNNADTTTCSQGNTLMKCSAHKQNGQAMTIIGSRHLISNPNLLQMLETRYNLTVMERDYGQQDTSSELEFADIIVDEKTCVVLHAVHRFTDSYQLEPLVSKVVALSLMFTTCWIIFHDHDHDIKKKDVFCDSFVRNISKLNAAFSCFNIRQTDFEVKMLTCLSTEDTAANINNICNICQEKSSVWKPTDYNKLGWISDHISMDERMLLFFPCLNSFSAQKMLQQMTLNKLLRSPYRHLTSELPWMAEKVLKVFCQLVNSDKGLQLRNCTSIESFQSDILYQESGLNKVNATVPEASPDSHHVYSLFNENQCNEAVGCLENRNCQKKCMLNDDLHSMKDQQPVDHPCMQQERNYHKAHFESAEFITQTKSLLKQNYDQNFQSGSGINCLENVFLQNKYSEDSDHQQINNLCNAQVMGYNKADDQTCTQDDILYLQESPNKINEFVRAEIEGQPLHTYGKSSMEDRFHEYHLADTSNYFPCTTLGMSIGQGYESSDPDMKKRRLQNQKPLLNVKVNSSNSSVGNQLANNDQFKYSGEDLYYTESIRDYGSVSRSLPQKLRPQQGMTDDWNLLPECCSNESLFLQNNHNFNSSNSLDLSNSHLFETGTKQAIWKDKQHLCQSNIRPNINMCAVKPSSGNYPQNRHPDTRKNQNYINQDFARTLSHTTQNILKQAVRQDCHRFQSYRPLHRISIGLAQPLRREGNVQAIGDRERTREVSTQQFGGSCNATDGRSFTVSNEPMMPVSPGSLQKTEMWTGYDSPPMDLEFSSYSPCHGPKNEEKVIDQQLRETKGQSSVFLPRKKMKLTYHMVPGVKGGQTKLVFK